MLGAESQDRHAGKCDKAAECNERVLLEATPGWSAASKARAAFCGVEWWSQPTMEQTMNLKTIFAAATLLFAVAPACATTDVPVDVLPSTTTTLYKVDGAKDESNKYDLWCYIDKIKAYRREGCRDEHGVSDGWMSVDDLQQSGHE